MLESALPWSSGRLRVPGAPTRCGVDSWCTVSRGGGTQRQQQQQQQQQPGCVRAYFLLLLLLLLILLPPTRARARAHTHTRTYTPHGGPRWLGSVPLPCARHVPTAQLEAAHEQGTRGAASGKALVQVPAGGAHRSWGAGTGACLGWGGSGSGECLSRGVDNVIGFCVRLGLIIN